MSFRVVRDFSSIPTGADVAAYLAEHGIPANMIRWAYIGGEVGDLVTVDLRLYWPADYPATGRVGRGPGGETVIWATGGAADWHAK